MRTQRGQSWSSRFSVSGNALKRGLQLGFSLIEIMVAVALMTVIMLGLLAMFYQTQRAMRVGSAQVDVLGTGDAAIQLLASELKQVAAAGNFIYPNIEVTNGYGPLDWARSFSKANVPQRTYLRELFFLRQENDDWIGTGYFVDPVTDNGGAGALYRFESRYPVTRSDAVELLYKEFKGARTTSVPRLADRVAHLQLYAFNADGVPFQYTNSGLTFAYTNLPSYMDLELGIIEPKPYDKFKARYDTNNPAVTGPIAVTYLSTQIDRLHLFRQRIPIRTVQ